MENLKKLLSAFFLQAICASAIAQSEMSIQGYVQDQTAKNIQAVTVSLLNATDSSLLKTAITDKDGKFDFIAPATAYLLHFDMVGYESTFSKTFTLIESPEINIVLQPVVKKLEGVTVQSKKPLIEIKADKTIFNVENSINATGSNALELLQKSPGVRVDNNDNIGMKGKNGVKIYVDGKMTQLSSKDLAAYLKGINSNDVESIEMISNPSAKYDASGNAGIINIKLKKNKRYGTNGSVSTGFSQGYTAKGSGSVHLNFRDKKVNVFGSTGWNGGLYRNTQDIYRIQSDSIYDQHSRSKSKNSNFNAKAGADFFINKNNTLGVLTTLNTGDGVWSNSSFADVIYQPTNAYEKTLSATNRMPNSYTNFNSNINYRFTDSTGKEINADADFGTFNSRRKSHQPNVYTNGNGDLLYQIAYRNHTPTDIKIYSLKADVELNKWKGKFGYGAKMAFVTTDNAVEFFTDKDGLPIKNLDKSNQFKYMENVYAAYANYQRELNKKWSLQAGLRLEQTQSEGNLNREDGVIQDDNNVKRKYLDFFPSAALTYNMNEKHTLNVTYSRRIDRPSYQDLNPFEIKLDELTFQKGNAFLNPQYTDNFELSHTFKSSIVTTLGFSNIKDFRAEFLDTANANATYSQQRNLANQKVYSFNIASPLKITKWWSGYANFYFNYQQFRGKFESFHIDVDVKSYGGYMQNTFALGKDYVAEISGYYMGPGMEGTLRSKPSGSMDIGLKKDFLNKKATVKLSFTDVFYTARWTAVSDFQGLYATINSRWESQTFRMNFTYRFGNKQVAASRQRKSGLEAEKGRIKGGN